MTNRPGVRLCGLLLVRDEADVVRDHLLHAIGLCDLVAVLDNGSTDGTAEIVDEMAAEFPQRILNFGVDTQPYRRDLRRPMYDELRTHFGPLDWFLQLDADEFLADDPKPLLELANHQGYDRVRTWQAQFHFTDVDLARWESGLDRSSTPIQFRRRYYQVDWREDRFWRNDPTRPWQGEFENLPRIGHSVAPWAIVNRHYPLRDPEQIQRRLDLRAQVRNDRAFQHVVARHWRDEVTPAKGLRYWDHVDLVPEPQPWRFYARRAKMMASNSLGWLIGC